MTNQQQSILNEYPLPISKLYLKVQNSSDKREMNKSLLTLFEFVLKYIALVSLKEFQECKSNDYKVSEAIDRLDEPKGLGVGNWANLLEQCHQINLLNNKTILPIEYFETRSTYPFINKFCQIINRWDGKQNITSFSLHNFVDKAVILRNKASHPDLSIEMLSEVTGDFKLALEEFLYHMEWMKNYPLVFNEKREVANEEWVLSIIKLMGNESIKLLSLNIPLEQDIPSSVLLILDPNNKPYLRLDPILLLKKKTNVYLFNGHKGNTYSEYVCYDTPDRYDLPPDFRTRRKACILHHKKGLKWKNKQRNAEKHTIKNSRSMQFG